MSLPVADTRPLRAPLEVLPFTPSHVRHAILDMTADLVPSPRRLIPVGFVQKQQARQSTPRKDSSAKRAEELLKSVRDSKQSTAAAWNTVFQGRPVSAKTLHLAFTYLHQHQLYNDAVEGIQAAIRNDHAQPWMYDVLAIEMKLAKRPQNEINRVLLSRIDFAPGDQAQMLVTASTLTGFDAFDEAIKLCREAAKRTPWQPAVWSTARKVADESKDPEAILWSRAGTIRHVWEKDYRTLHEICGLNLDDLEQQLVKDKNPGLASKVREAKAEANQRDLRIIIQWAGDADLDLSVTEPNGKICSRKVPITANGGLLIQQSSGGKAARGLHSEEYVCPVAPSGEYKITVRYIRGKVTRGAVTVKQIRYQNTPRQLKTQVTETGVVDSNVHVKVQLANGRAKK